MMIERTIYFSIISHLHYKDNEVILFFHFFIACVREERKYSTEQRCDVKDGKEKNI